jgi:hypothetical protein
MCNIEPFSESMKCCTVNLRAMRAGRNAVNLVFRRSVYPVKLRAVPRKCTGGVRSDAEGRKPQRVPALAAFASFASRAIS